MMRSARRIAGLVVGLAAVLGIAGLSRVPYGASPGDHAQIRLSWRTPGELVNECRRPTAEELERLPVHMRREEICEGRIVPYRLRVRLNEQLVVDEVVRAAGAREDRPLYVFREIAVPPGQHRVEIDWRRESGGESSSPEESGSAADARRVPPPPLTLNATLNLADRQVVLITYDLDERVLVARGHGIVTVKREQ